MCNSLWMRPRMGQVLEWGWWVQGNVSFSAMPMQGLDAPRGGITWYLFGCQGCRLSEVQGSGHRELSRQLVTTQHASIDAMVQ